MKKWSKKVWMSTAAVLIAIMSVSAIPASADTSRVIWFTIQNNSVCSTSGHYTTVYINLNNISSSAANVTVNLYNDDGVAVTATGLPASGGGYMASTFQPGSPFMLGGKQTKHYYAAFGTFPGGSTCENRPAYGNIVVDDSGLLLANGEIKGTSSGSTTIILSNTNIIINGGQPF